MPDTNDIFYPNQEHPLNIKVNTNEKPYPTGDLAQKQLEPRRLSSYFIVLIESGNVAYKLDLQDITIGEGDLLFAMPNQIFAPPIINKNLKYYKVLFDENTLALLPLRFAFLVNPLGTQCLKLESDARERVKNVFEILNQLFNSKNVNAEIILAYLNLLLTELNIAYFNKETNEVVNSNLSKFVEFKLMVETHLTDQPSISTLAEKLALTPNGLYRLVKEYAGTSPKDFFTHRLMMEAQRKLRYSNLSVKELAYELGFNDPDYFSRLFKKNTGKSVSEFLENQDL